MARSQVYTVPGGPHGGYPVTFSLDNEGTLTAELGGDIYANEEMLEDFAADCGYSLEEIRAELEGAAGDDEL